MVDSLGSLPVSNSDRKVATVSRVSPLLVATPVSDSMPAAANAAAPQTLASELAAQAPVDSDRVAQIKAAVQNGTFPILPLKIADQLIALRLEWTQGVSHDQA